MNYLVATAVGGIMEQPHITYEDPQWIEAESEEEAEDKYNKINNCNYFYGEVIGTEETGQTKQNEPVRHNSFN